MNTWEYFEDFRIRHLNVPPPAVLNIKPLKIREPFKLVDFPNCILVDTNSVDSVNRRDSMDTAEANHINKEDIVLTNNQVSVERAGMDVTTPSGEV